MPESQLPGAAAMDLKEFISNSLTQIIDGIRDAQERSAASGAWISPVGAKMPAREGAGKVAAGGMESYLDEVKFDVAVTVNDDVKGGVSGGLKVIAISLEAGGTTSTRHGAESRIQFAIPVIWPGVTNEGREEKIKQARDIATQKMNEARANRPSGWMGN